SGKPRLSDSKSTSTSNGKSDGRTEEVYLVNRDRMLIAGSEGLSHSAFQQKISSFPVEQCFIRGRDEHGQWNNYKKTEVVGSSACLIFEDFAWTLVVEQSVAEAFGALSDVRDLFLKIVSGTLVLAVVVAWFFAGRLTRPVLLLQEEVKRLEKGALTEPRSIESNDEIGDLARSFKSMAVKLLESQKNLAEQASKTSDSLADTQRKNDALQRVQAEMTEILRELDGERVKFKDSEEKLRTIIKTALDGIIVIDEKGLIDTFNPAAEKMFGYSAEEIYGKSINMLMTEPHRSEHDSYIQRYLATGEAHIVGVSNREVKAVRKDGSVFDLELAVNEMFVGGKRLFVGIVNDITARIEAKELLLQQKKDVESVNLELDRFVYTASHDLRAPLRGISTFAQFIKADNEKKLDERSKDYLDRIIKGVSRLSSLIDDLLKLSRISRIRNPFELVDVKALIKGVVEGIELEMENHSVELDFPSPIPQIVADRIKLGEVFLNLISNAIKFSSKNNKDKPRVQIGYASREGFHEFSIRDNGIGIDPAYHEKIFDIFQRLHKADEYEGTGAGLSIVKRIVEDHGGSIRVESELGTGTNIIFTISKNLKADS
ncbi:MAG: PAS domain S-box protein, partial [Deltaproteobacteria bacterium]|nr:PAS domain S-box protein [Deltaproteobacteria bacterium]